MRIIEGLYPLIIISIGLVLIQIYTLIIKFGRKLKLRAVRWRKVYSNKFLSKLSWKGLSIAILVLISVFTYSYARNNFVYIYIYKDSMMNCIFYIHENFEPNMVIGVPDLNDTGSHSIYDLLYDYRLIYYSQNNNWTVEEFFNFTQSNHFDGFIIKLDLFQVGFIDEFLNYTLFQKIAGGPTIDEFSLYHMLV